MSYPYWPNGSVVGYQNLAFNSNTNVLTLQPGGNSVNLTTSGGGSTVVNTSIVNTSTININPVGDGTAITIINETGPAAFGMNAATTASMSISGQEASLTIQGSQNGQMQVITSLVGEDANANIFEVSNDPALKTTHTNVLTNIVANDNYGAALNLQYISSGVLSHQGRFEVYSNETAVSSMVVGLYDSANTPLAELGFSSGGLATNVMSAQLFYATNGGLGPGSLFYPGFTHAADPLDILQAIPLARVLNSNGGDATSSSGLNQFGRMTHGQIYQGIPATSWSDAAKVVLAPRTYFNVFTGPMGSGGSAQYNNQANDLYSTFTVEPYQTSNTFNSYVLGFGN